MSGEQPKYLEDYKKKDEQEFDIMQRLGLDTTYIDPDKISLLM